MTLYHWTLNPDKLKEKGFVARQDRHSDGKLGIWFTDQIVGSPESVRPEMSIVTIDVFEDDIAKYEEINEGAGYRAFSIPADVVNQYELKFPTLYIDRGLFTIVPYE